MSRSQAERIAELERRLANVDAKFRDLFTLMEEATVAAGITVGNPEYTAEARAQSRRRALHVVRPGDTR